jgi:hypothetical protein
MGSQVPVTLKRYMQEAGGGLASDMGGGNPSLYDVLKGIVNGLKNRMTLRADAPTTASTQVTGAGATTWRVNLSAGLAIVDGVVKDFVAQADRVIHSATQLVTSGQSCVAAIVAKNVAGTITLVDVKGVAATTGAQVAPSDATIQAAVGAGVSWVKVCEITINRTADTTVTQSQDNSKGDVGINIVVES